MANKNPEAAARAKLRSRRRWRQALGALVCVLVVLGIFSALGGSVRLVASMFDDTEERAEYAARLDVLVGLDPLPFNTMSEANKSTLLDAAVWGSIAGTNSADYEHDEVGAMYLPTTDIDKTVAALYGPDIKFNYATFTDRNLTYTYVPEKQAYLVPITSVPTDYAPLVMRIKREGNTKRVTVGYDSPYDQSDLAVKYNDYIFTKASDGVYYLTAIVASEMKAEILADSNATSGAASLPLDGNAVLDNAAAEILPESLSAASVASESTSTSESASAEDDTASSKA